MRVVSLVNFVHRDLGLRENDERCDGKVQCGPAEWRFAQALARPRSASCWVETPLKDWAAYAWDFFGTSIFAAEHPIFSIM